ncbi:TPA: hypothetical protein ACM7T7_001153 [Streptococcus pyogenes]|uniref:hypothetical protein n=1 Tax=Streptococcus pyogenes TaxID=1314 RepID=UPI0010DA214A|nr:hypothetical protein [Streptococcus pyogenes]VGU20789.1 hypothetical membrane associated protein [Streptococcus pyogenes]
MKTRSKHFLNLATLCLALLGTTLLMVQPVKASTEEESYTTYQEGYESFTEASSGDLDTEEDGMSSERKRGFSEGFKAGQYGTSSSISRDNIALPTDKGSNWDRSFGDTDYKDGYEDGYRKGWQKGHPIAATLEWLWQVITSWFQ